MKNLLFVAACVLVASPTFAFENSKDVTVTAQCSRTSSASKNSALTNFETVTLKPGQVKTLDPLFANHQNQTLVALIDQGQQHFEGPHDGRIFDVSYYVFQLSRLSIDSIIKDEHQTCPYSVTGETSKSFALSREKTANRLEFGSKESEISLKYALQPERSGCEKINVEITCSLKWAVGQR